jgi:hypothetical protein
VISGKNGGITPLSEGVIGVDLPTARRLDKVGTWKSERWFGFRPEKESPEWSYFLGFEWRTGRLNTGFCWNMAF